MSKFNIVALVVYAGVLVSTAWAQSGPPGFLVYNQMKSLVKTECETQVFWWKEKKFADDANLVSQAEFTSATKGRTWSSACAPTWFESSKAASPCAPNAQVSYMTCADFVKNWGTVPALGRTSFWATWPVWLTALSAAEAAGDIGCAENGSVCFKLGGNFQNYWWCIGQPPKGQTGLINIYDSSTGKFLTKDAANAVLKSK